MKAVACFGTQSCACSYSPDSHVCSSQPVFLVCRPLAVCKIIQSRSEAILGDTMLDSYLHITWVRVDETFQHMWDASFAGYCTTSTKGTFTMKSGDPNRSPVDALSLDIEDQLQRLMLEENRPELDFWFLSMIMTGGGPAALVGLPVSLTSQPALSMRKVNG